MLFWKRFVSAAVLASLSALAFASDLTWKTVDDIAAQLKGKPPMAVGFDVDETVLFTAAVFYHVAQAQCDGALTECKQTQAFWDEANRLDSFSLPKQAGVELVKMHLARGDTVYFITARTASKSKEETLTQTLRDLFDAPQLAPVIFTGYTPEKNLKIQPIKSHDIQVYYGDSDTDMTAAIAAGAQPIRLLRAKNSLETHSVPHLGAYKEVIIVDSDI